MGRGETNVPWSAYLGHPLWALWDSDHFRYLWHTGRKSYLIYRGNLCKTDHLKGKIIELDQDWSTVSLTSLIAGDGLCSASMTYPDFQQADSSSCQSGKGGDSRPGSSLGAKSYFPINGYKQQYIWARWQIPNPLPPLLMMVCCQQACRPQTWRLMMLNPTSVQFSSVALLCPTLYDPMDCSTPGFPVHHQLPELAQTHVHQVSDAIQPSYPLSSPSPAFSLSQNQIPTYLTTNLLEEWPQADHIDSLTMNKVRFMVSEEDLASEPGTRLDHSRAFV